MSPTFKNAKILLATLLVLSVLLSACSAPPPVTTAATNAPTASGTAAPTAPPTDSGGAVSFSKDIAPILQSRCLSCHGGNQTAAGLSVATYDTLMVGSQNGAVIVPSDSDNSLLIKLVVSKRMPRGGAKLLPDQIQLLIDWVKAGALNN